MRLSRPEHERLAEGKVALLDLRTPWQFARERVPGAANVPAGEPGPSGLLFHFRKVRTPGAFARAASAGPPRTCARVHPRKRACVHLRT